MGYQWYHLLIAFWIGILVTLLVTGRRLIQYGRIARIMTLQYHWERIWFLESIRGNLKLKRAVELLDEIAWLSGCNWIATRDDDTTF